MILKLLLPVGHLSDQIKSYINFVHSDKRITEEKALDLALDSLKANLYMWQSSDEEQNIKEIKSDPNATWYPKASLIYVPSQLDFSQSDFKLTYKFNIHAITPRKAENIYIDVQTGSSCSSRKSIACSRCYWKGLYQIQWIKKHHNRLVLRQPISDLETIQEVMGFILTI